MVASITMEEYLEKTGGKHLTLKAVLAEAGFNSANTPEKYAVLPTDGDWTNLHKRNLQIFKIIHPRVKRLMEEISQVPEEDQERLYKMMEDAMEQIKQKRQL